MGKIFYFVLFLILTSSIACSQCTSSLGTPIINETFGSGTNTFGPPLPASVTNMEFVYDTCPNDGQYSIVNYTSGCWGNGWHTLTDHTGDKNGYFMLINASYQPSDFFVQTINSLCAGTTYEFSSWIINMGNNTGGILPNITFTIEKTDGTILSSYNSGDVPVINPATWGRYGFFFKTPVGVSTVVVRMHNNAAGGLGNDLALDDIGFSPAGPGIVVGITGSKSDTLNNSCGLTTSLFSTVGTCYIQNTYQWQISTDDVTWSDIPGAVNQNYFPVVQSSGTYFYRLSVAENGNIANVNCRANSNVAAIIYQPFAPPLQKNISALICHGSSYTLPSGKMVSNAGSYSDTLFNKNGCDSLVFILNLKEKPLAFSSITAAICQGQSYFGQTKTGIYTDTLNAANGCDSIRTLNLTVTPLTYSTVNVSICSGGSYLGYSKAGTYIDTLNAANGCDSIRTLTLTIKPIAYSTLTVAICQGQTYLGYTKSGIYIDTLAAANGCDSVRTVNLTVKLMSFAALSATICQGSVYLGHNKSGVYTDTLVAANGCDSIRTLNLIVKPWSYSTLNVMICSGENYLGYTKTGTYVDTLMAANGCDSIRTINLTVPDRPKPNFGSNTLLCAGDTVLLNPGVFSYYLWQDSSTSPYFKVTTAGTYWVKVTDENGCEAADTVSINEVYCSVVKIPNAFTPNGDGINDTWDVYVLQFYPNCKVFIYTRWGQLVFSSTGYPKAWDGTFNGKQLPVGTYYYIIDLKNNKPLLSGYVAIIR
jgi:gliding motility-associated-like protein